MALTTPERRSNPRVQIDGPMSYRHLDSEELLPGQIENISSNGALIWVGEDLPLDTELVVRIQPDNQEDAWADFVVTLLYQLPEEENSLYGYGCAVELA